MELINNEYKIIKKIEQNRKISSYAVQDIVNNKIRKLIIINSDYLSKTLINFLINNFTDLSNVETQGISKVFNFGLVSSIDNKRLLYKQYYYTSEYLKDYYKISSLIENISYKEIIDVYIQICMAINYLHLRGIKYEEINLENILLYKKDNKLKVKLMDLVTLEVENSYLKGEINGGLIFKAPEILNGQNATIESDIYSLGVLAVILFFMKNNITVDLKTDIHSIINDNLLDGDKLHLNKKIKKIITRMICNNPNERYHNINEIVHDVNDALETNYKSYNINEIEKINVNIPIVDREYELKTIISEYRFMKEKNGENKCIFVHGETGIGKTKVLKEVERILSLDGINVYSTFPSANNGRNKNLIEFCKKIICSCREGIGETYKEEFEKFIPQIDEHKSFISLEAMCSFHEKVRLFKVAENFIKEVFKEQSSVIIIDNISVFKKISLEALEYVYNSQSIKNLIIILSYNEEDLLDPVFFNFINRMNKNNATINIPLKGLSFEGTACLIEKLLGLSEYPIKFSKKIYSETYGNPLFIEETIKNLLLNEIIYIEEKTGKWGIAYNGDYDSLPMPRSIEQAFISELNKIGAESYFILEFISIFTDGVCQKIIEEFMKKDGLNYDEIMEDLTSKGILCRKIEDTGFIYDFCSKILKDLVYEKIEEKVEMHREAGELLIKCAENNIENRQEIIYHLERSNQNIRAVEYYIENASKMILLRNHREALLNLKKASQLLPYRYNDEKTRILLKMADIYMDLFKFKSAQKILDSAKNIVLETKNKKYEVDVLNREGNICLNKNNYSMALEKINLVDELLSKVEYKKGFIDSRIILANIYYKTGEYSKVISICNEGIIACGSEFIKPKIVLYNIRGNGNMYLKNFDEAVRDYGLVYKNSKSTNYKKGIVFAYINLAKIYEDYYQISDIAEEYLLKVIDICEKNKFLYYEIIALEKLGEIYNRRFEYEKALSIFEDALFKSEFIEYKNGIVQGLSYIGIIQLKLSNYKEVFKNLNLVEKYIERNKSSIENIHQYYLLKGEILIEVGLLKESKEYLTKALKAYEKEENLLKLKIKELLVFIKLIDECGEINLEKYIEYIKNMASNYKNYSNKIDYIFSCAIILYDQGYIKYALRLVNYIYQDNWISSSDRVKLKEMYFKGLMFNGEQKLAFLYETLKLVEQVNMKKVQCRIYIRLGDYFNEVGQYNFAAYYYFEACEIIRDITEEIPSQYRLKYFKFNNFVKPFERINFIKLKYFEDKIYDENLEENVNIVSEKDLKEVLKFKKFIDLLDNKKFMKSMRKIYNEFFSIKIRRQRDIISNLQCDSIKNLKLIIQYISSKTLATEAEIVIEEGENNFKTIASLTGNDIREENKEIIERVKKTKSAFYVFNNEVCFTNFKYKSLMDGKRAFMCIPIMLYENDDLISKDKKHVKRNAIINGYIYVSSNKFLNSINKNTLNEIMKLINLIAYIIDKYQLTISCSIDKLTGAYTRKYLEDKLSESIEYANFNNDQFSIIMFDLDNFKSVNDTFGHQVGDKVLNNVCNIVMDNLREGDICGRYGGEEFIAVLRGIGESKALSIAERIRTAVEQSKILGDKHPVTISIGICTYPQQAQLKRELIEKADQALYIAKDCGRNRCMVWKKEFKNKVKVTSKLTGIISGNFAQDSRNVLAMIELMDIVNSDLKFEQKVYKILGYITGITEAEYSNLIFLSKDNKIKENFGRKRLQEDWSYEYVCNKKILDDVINQKQGTCIMEWNETFNSDFLTVLPEWYSVMVVPIINKNFMKAILYLAIPSKIKKFTREELNFVTILSKIIKDI